jgi:gluconate 5-dehydrogenase
MSLELFDLNGRIALITGSSRGIGFAIAEGLGKAGATIVANGVNEQRLNEAVKTFSEKGLEAYGYAFDVTRPEQIKQKVQTIETEIGPIDILVNNAGIIIRCGLEDFNEEDWQRIVDINLTGTFLVSKCVVNSMIKRKSGKIINICSIQSELARPATAAYAASKGGVKMLTKAMATEWGKYNIQVNGLGPGYSITDITKPLVEDKNFNSWLCSRTPAGRWGSPSDLVGGAIFLASKASDYVNGHILYIDGGMLSCV